ncbi:MAG: hypothetical protein Tsb005_15960 [Gammaproteobacteria bacterium]
MLTFNGNKVINCNKALIFIFIPAVMLYYHAEHNYVIWIYFAMHGSYVFSWLVASHYYPEKSFEIDLPISLSATLFTTLSLYWIAPWLIAKYKTEVMPWYLFICVFLFGIGMSLHAAADTQKAVTLKFKKGLITEGYFTRIRHINYLGEFMIYLSFALLAQHWLPLAILFSWVAFVWIPRMIKKERSLSRYPEFEEYKKRSKWFIPFVL